MTIHVPFSFFRRYVAAGTVRARSEHESDDRRLSVVRVARQPQVEVAGALDLRIFLLYVTLEIKVSRAEAFRILHDDLFAEREPAQRHFSHDGTMPVCAAGNSVKEFGCLCRAGLSSTADRGEEPWI